MSRNYIVDKKYSILSIFEELVTSYEMVDIMYARNKPTFCKVKGVVEHCDSIVGKGKDLFVPVLIFDKCAPPHTALSKILYQSCFSSTITRSASSMTLW